MLMEKKVMPLELPKMRVWPGGEAGLSMVTVSVALGVRNVKEVRLRKVAGSMPVKVRLRPAMETVPLPVVVPEGR